MINHYFRQHQDFDELVQGLGQKILEYSSAIEVQDQLTDEEAVKKDPEDLFQAIVAKEA